MNILPAVILDADVRQTAADFQVETLVLRFEKSTSPRRLQQTHHQREASCTETHSSHCLGLSSGTSVYSNIYKIIYKAFYFILLVFYFILLLVASIQYIG